MKIYKCDNCGQTEVGTPKVTLDGVATPSGDILIPGGSEKTFCGHCCFWLWTRKEGKHIHWKNIE